MEAATLGAPSRMAAARHWLGDLRWPVRIALVILALAALAAAFGSLLAPNDPNHVSLSAAFESPGGSYLLGGDASGRDIFSRLLAGARSTLVPPLLICLVATALGALIGIGMAWRGGFVDTAAAAGLNVVFAFPGLLAAILAVAVFGKGLVAPSIALGIVYLPYIARVVRAAALRERSQPYASALIVQGFSSWRIVSRHIAPNIAPVLIAQAVITFSYAMIDLAAIDFLGLGLQPPASDWGVMVASGQSAILGGHAMESLSAALCIVAVIVSVNVVGEQFSDGPEARAG